MQLECIKRRAIRTDPQKEYNATQKQDNSPQRVEASKKTDEPKLTIVRAL